MRDRQSSPVVARRQLGDELQRLRGRRTQEAASKELGWGIGKVKYIEAGKRALALDDLQKVFAVYGIDGDPREALERLCEAGNGRGWWDEYHDVDLSESGKRFIGYEWGCRRIRSFAGTIMPALLQIPAYAEAALRSGIKPRPPEQVARLIEIRRLRQRVLGPPDPLEYHVVLDEAGLRRPGGAPETMQAQLGHIVDLAETRSNVVVQIVPFSAGLYAAQSGTFVIMDFDPEADGPGLVHVEPGFVESLYVEDQRDIYLYSQVFQHLLEVALSPEDSIELLRTVAYEDERGHR